MRRKSVLPERELFSKTKAIIENIKGVKVDLSYGRGENYIGVDSSPASRYYINIASPKVKNIEKYTALQHELSHIMFDSPISELPDLFQEDLDRIPEKYRDTAKHAYIAAYNIIEDQRIESMWGKIYLGTKKRFVKARELLGKDMKHISHPVESLLAARFFRDDLVPKEEKLAIEVIKNVECTEREASVILTKEYIKKVLEPYILSMLPLPSIPKQSCNAPCKNGQNKKSGGESQSIEVGKPQSSEGAQESQSNVNKGTNKIDSFATSVARLHASSDHRRFREASCQKLNQNTIKKGKSQIDGLRKQGDKKIDEVRKELQNNIAKTERKILPASMVDVKFLDRDSGCKGKPDMKMANQLNKVFRLLQSKKKVKFDEYGEDMSILQVIKRKTLGYGEVFTKKIDSNNLAVYISIDASGSMSGEQIDTTRDMVSTLFESLKHVKGVKLKVVVWSSDSYGKLGLTDVANQNETHKIETLRESCLTPTHLAVRYSSVKLQQMGCKNKLLIVLTDGYPNYYVNGNRLPFGSVMETTKSAIKDTERTGTKVLGILVGAPHMAESMETMFGKNYIIVNNIKDAADRLIYNVKKVIIRQIRRN